MLRELLRMLRDDRYKCEGETEMSCFDLGQMHVGVFKAVPQTFLNSTKFPRFTGSVTSEKYLNVKLISFCNFSSPM